MTDDIKPVLTEQDIEDIIMTGGHSNVAGGIYATSVYAFAKDVAIAAVLADREGRQQWQPIETAPTDNKRLLYLARFDKEGTLVELDFDGSWEYWEESWEMSHINGYCWMSNNGIEEPTHWAYQDEPLPATQRAKEGGSGV